MHNKSITKISISALVVAASATFALPAFAGSMTIGSTLGQSCFEEAKWGRDDLDAVKLCNRALTDSLLTSKDAAATYVNRGIIRASRGDLDGAIHDYDAALKMRPDLGEAFANKGAAYLRGNNVEEALHQLNTALQYNLSQPAHVYYNIAVAQEGLGNTKEAYYNYQKAAELNPEWAWPRNELMRFTVIED